MSFDLSRRIAAGVFAGMSIIGYTTHVDLTR